MAALNLVAHSGDQTLVANTAKTVLQLVAPTQQRLRIQGFSVTVAGTLPVDLTLRVLRQTTAGTGTPLIPVKLEPGADETIQTTVATNFSAEPTAGDVLQFKRLQGSYEKIFPLGQEIIVEGGGRIGIEVTCPATATVAAEFVFEE
jgi:hypothetical protein